MTWTTTTEFARYRASAEYLSSTITGPAERHLSAVIGCCCAATMANAHEVEGFRIGDRLQRIAFTVNGKKKSRVQLELDEDGSAVLTIGAKVYVLIPEPEPKSVIFSSSGSDYEALVLKQGETVTASEPQKAFLLDGNSSFNVHGEDVTTRDNSVLYNGRWYSEGDEITINGRTAIIHSTPSITCP
jgi:hypothetical protein